MDSDDIRQGIGPAGHGDSDSAISQLFEKAMQAEQQGDANLAESLYRQIIAMRPRLVEPQNNLATILINLRRYDQAAEILQQVVQLEPNRFEIHANLAFALRGAQRFAEAAEHFRRALALNADMPDMRSGLAEVCMILGQVDQAMQIYLDVLAKKPDDLDACLKLGNIAARAQRLNEAQKWYTQALKLNPERAGIYNDLGIIERFKGRYSEAKRLLEKAIELDSKFLPSFSNLAIVLQNMGQQRLAAETYRQALAANPNLGEVHSNLLLGLHYIWDFQPEEIYQESLRWARQHAPLELAARSHANTPEPARRLRIGYISPDIRTHSVAYFLEPILDAHDRGQVELFCYAHVQVPDATTFRLKAKFDNYRNVHSLPHSHVAEMIQKDRIDILVDLAGHAGNERVFVLAFKAAPVQVTYLGYPNTTGMTQVDYRLTDALADPPGAERLYTEHLVRLPGTFLCYKPPPTAPPVAPLPYSIKRYITFGSFSTDVKVTPEVIALWCRVLRAVPNSQMLLKFTGAGDDVSREYYLSQFEANGVDRSRVQIVRRLPLVESHLAAYNQVDIVLDTFPYHGTTTTCEGMWMGAPLVSLAGQAHVSRVGAGLLDAVGLPELLAGTEDEYVAKAAALAANPARLARIRSTLRDRMAHGRLCDAAAFARNLEYAYRGMWLRWCRNQGVQLTSAQEACAAFDFTQAPPPQPPAAAKVTPSLEVPPMTQTQPSQAVPAAPPAPAAVQGPIKMARPVNVVELAVLADAMYHLGQRMAACHYAIEGLDAIAAGQNYGKPPRALLENWQAHNVQDMLVRLVVSLGGFSTYFTPGRSKHLLLMWSGLEKQNPQPFLRFGLACALEAAQAGQPTPPAALDALRYAHAIMQNERSALALALTRGNLYQVCLPYDGATIHLYPSLMNLTTYVLLEQGDWFEDDLALFRALIRPADKVLDLGANVGVYSLSAAVRNGPAGRVVSVEPCQATYDLIARSAAAHPHMQVLHAAVGEASGTVRLAPGNAPELNRVQADSQVGEEVECLNVDDLADRVGVDGFDLIKMDVEGLEIPVIHGAKRVMGQRAPIIFYEFKEGQTVHLELIDEFASLGYDSYYYSPGRGAIVRYQKDEPLDGFLLNMIAARPESLPRFEGLVNVL